VKIQEAFPGRVQKFELQYKEHDAWRTILFGTQLSDVMKPTDGSRLGRFSVKFLPITARNVRLNILEASEGPTIAEIQWIERKEKR
jgi:hypothetical protein